MDENAVSRSEQTGVSETGSLSGTVSRREFLKMAAIAGAGITFAGGLGGLLAGCGGEEATTTTAGATTTSVSGTTTTADATTTSAAGATTTTVAPAGPATFKDLFGPGGPEAGQGLVWKHGLNMSLSGIGAMYGKVMGQGAKTAARLIEENGGPKIEFLENDHENGSVDASVNGIRRLIKQEGIKSLTTSWGAPSTALFPVVAQEKVLMLWSGGGGPAVIDKDYSWCTMAFTVDDAAPGALGWLRKQFPDKTKMSVLGQTETGYDTVNNIIPKVWPELGGTIVSADTANMGQTDYSSTVARLKSANPDVIFSTFYGTDMGYLIKQVRQAGMTAPIMHIDYVSTVLDIAGEYLEQDNYIANEYFEVANPNPLGQIFLDAYAQDWNGEVPDYFSANFFESTLMLYDLIKRSLVAGVSPPTGTSMNDAILKPSGDFWSVYGGGKNTETTKMTFQQDHSVVKPLAVCQFGKTGIEKKLATIKKGSAEVEPA